MCSSSCVDRKRKDPRQEGVAPSGFSRFPAAEGDSDDEDDYEKERRKRGGCPQGMEQQRGGGSD